GSGAGGGTRLVGGQPAARPRHRTARHRGDRLVSRAPAGTDDDGIAHPRQTTALFGHAAAERTLLDAYRSGRIPHAWLIGGSPGIGKATLAFRMARFVLAHPDPTSPVVQTVTTLAIAPDHPAAGLIAAQSHPDLLVLERTLSD